MNHRHLHGKHLGDAKKLIEYFDSEMKGKDS